jgi:hypothetical protein
VNEHKDGSGSTGLAVGGWGEKPHWGVYASLLLTSVALLTLEVSLTRFFSHTIWYHFAYLTISVALLGFGSSGAIVAAFPRMLARRGESLLVAGLLAAAVLTAGGLVFLARHPIEVQNLMNKPLHFSISLLAYYLIVASPFLLAGFAVGVPFAAWPSRMGRLYFWDLAGAALGCAAVAPLVGVIGIPGLVLAAAAMMVLAAASLVAGSGRRGAGAALAALAFVGFAVAGPAGESIPLLVTSSKNLTELRGEGGIDPFATRPDSFHQWTAINRVDAFGWDKPSKYSFWSRVGMNNSWDGPVPLVARLTYDGSNGSDIYSFHGDMKNEFEMFEHHILRLPYLNLDRPEVLVIGVGGGVDLFNAIKQGARHVTGAELQPVTVDLLKNRLRDFNSGFFTRDDVSLVASEGRHFVRKTDKVFDLVQITAVDTFAAQAAGAYVLAESYLYTVEAMRDYLRRLGPDGVVTTVVGDLVFPEQLPPLATRLAMIGYRALQAEGVADPGAHIVMVGSIAEGSLAQNESVMIRKRPFRPEEIERIRAFTAANGFTMMYAPGLPGEPRLAAMLGRDEAVRARVMDDAWFNMEATTDGDPFFYNVGKWKNFSPDKGIFFTMPGSFMGQMVLVLMVLQSTLLGAVLVLLPLVRGAREGLTVPGATSYLAYFLALGVGFMFVEISFVQSFVLFLGSPTYALSVTIFALLAFSALGSLASTRVADRPEAALRVLAPVVAVLIGVYALGLASVFDAALHLDLGARIAIAVAAQMPMGLVLGMFMPLGIACVAREHSRLVPWAWGVNGVGSVTGTTLAVLLAMAAGFRVVALVAAALYLLGTFLLLKASSSRAAH